MKKIIGIIGGMGPDASNHFYKLLISHAREIYFVNKNSEYPNIILHSNPVPDFIEDYSQVETAKKMLQASVDTLSTVCTRLSIACNTAHLYLPELQQTTNVPFISIIDVVVADCKKKGYKKVGILATPTTLKTELYQKVLIKNNIDFVLPDEEEIKNLGKAVKYILAGDFIKSKSLVLRAADSLLIHNIDAIILGCTELPLIFPQEYKVPSTSSLESLSKALLTYYYEDII